MAEKNPDVIDIPDNDGGDDWQDIGPINVKEVAAYKEKVDKSMSGPHRRWHQHCRCSTRGTRTTRILPIISREMQMRRGKTTNNISSQPHIRSTWACQYDVGSYFEPGKSV